MKALILAMLLASAAHADVSHHVFMQKTFLHYMDEDGEWNTKVVSVPEIPNMFAASCLKAYGKRVAACFYVAQDHNLTIMRETVLNEEDI